MLGIISGNIQILEPGYLNNLKRVVKENEFGQANLLVSGTIAFLSRHGCDPGTHILPHLINHQANMKALKDMGVSKVIGVNSTGSLSKDLQPGAIVIPDDFIMLSPAISIYENSKVHIVPCLNMKIRSYVLQAACNCGIEVKDGGIYWQTTGPRLETRAEISMMSKFADIVGMTMASEAIIAGELGLPYAAICSVDNYAHGIGDNDLTMEEISCNARRSGKTISRILTRYVEIHSSIRDTF
jgi:5'-methylthioadenosine phosphorylase